MDGGRIVADGSTPDLLADDALLRAHRLELPYGFDPRYVRGR
jgi:cobalt/nickel transport system ATP-binding protein